MQQQLQGYFAAEGDEQLALYESEKLAKEVQLAEDRAFREQQDAEYESALQADRDRDARKERERLEQQEAQELMAAIKLSEELSQQQNAERAQIELEEKRQAIPPEPAGGDPALMLSIKVPQGKRLNRKWAPQTTVQQLVRLKCSYLPSLPVYRTHCRPLQYDFVFVHFADPSIDFELKTPFPSKSLSADKGLTLEEAGIGNQTVLLAVVVEPDEDEG